MKQKRKQNDLLEKQESKFLFVTKIISFFLGICGMFSCIEIDEMDKNLSGTTLFISFAIIGLILGYLVLFSMEKLSEELNTEVNKRSSIVVGGILSFFILSTPALANFINRTYSTKEKECKFYKAIRKGEQSGSNGYPSYWLYFKIENKEERVPVSEELHNSTQILDKFEICIYKGRLGFKFIKDINKI